MSHLLSEFPDNLKTGKDYNVVNDEIITGNIFSLITNSWNKLRPFLAYKTEFGMEAKFEQKYIYPEEAIREALINAITHRDYSIQNGIDIFIFNNRLEVSSPGRLLSTISIDDLRALKGAHESRNSLISKILRENSFVRELGAGLTHQCLYFEQPHTFEQILFIQTAEPALVGHA